MRWSRRRRWGWRQMAGYAVMMHIMMAIMMQKMSSVLNRCVRRWHYSCGGIDVFEADERKGYKADFKIFHSAEN